MDKIKFLLSDDIYSANIVKKNDNIIEISFETIMPPEKILLSGFYIINEYNGKNMSGNSYYAFTTMYNKISPLSVLLSNNNSIYGQYVPTTSFVASNNGSLNGKTTQVVSDYNELVIPSAIPDKNYKFDGWKPIVPESGTVAKDTTFIAMFTYNPTESEKRIVEIENEIDSLKKELATTDYIIIKSAEIDAIIDNDLKMAQLSLYEESYPNLQEIINNRISLREGINSLEEELNSLRE